MVEPQASQAAHDIIVRMGIAADAFTEAMNGLSAVLRANTAPMRLAFLRIGGSRQRVQCACGANPHANEWELHQAPSRIRRHPWRADREHRPV